MAMEPKDTFALLQHLIGCQNDQLKALERQHDELLIKIENYYQGAVQELDLNYKDALEKEQNNFVQTKQQFEKEFLRKFISTFGVDMVQQCLGDVCVTASENTPSTTPGSSPIMGSTSHKATKRGPGRPPGKSSKCKNQRKRPKSTPATIRRSRRTATERSASLTPSRETHDEPVLTVVSVIGSSSEIFTSPNKLPSASSTDDVNDESRSEGTITDNVAVGVRHAKRFEAGGRSLLCDDEDDLPLLLQQQLARS